MQCSQVKLSKSYQHTFCTAESQGETCVQTPHLLCANTWTCCQGGSSGASQKVTWPGGQAPPRPVGCLEEGSSCPPVWQCTTISSLACQHLRGKETSVDGLDKGFRILQQTSSDPVFPIQIVSYSICDSIIKELYSCGVQLY